MKNKLSNEQVIKSFLFTVEEYKRFAKAFVLAVVLYVI